MNKALSTQLALFEGPKALARPRRWNFDLSPLLAPLTAFVAAIRIFTGGSGPLPNSSSSELGDMD